MMRNGFLWIVVFLWSSQQALGAGSGEDAVAAYFAKQVAEISKAGWKKVAVNQEEVGNPLFQAFSKLDDKTSLVAMRFVAVIDYTLEQPAALWFGNDEVKKEWMDLCADYRIIEKASPTDYIHQIVTKSVFPTAARTFVNHATIVVDKEKKTIKGYSAAVDYPKAVIPEGAVLGRVHYSHTFMQELEGRKTAIDLSVLVDPGGMIPHFLVNLVASSWPAKTYRNFIGQLKKGRWEPVDFLQ